ncbi:hypothetical protein QWM81_05350 [Streptomyces ficellus]|uniref:Transferase n=1 Tax=Streptomyces ficellus TaxID=1977088 RepID=A0ABT7Z1X7_9ACTN|nr:hypothetical protein [Streptomyces ficellus]MDN3293473.1 hypothetical protein [Streptomyces ficellus]
MTDATTPAPVPPPGPGAPRADCLADSAGGITFDIVVVDTAEPVLVLRRRGGAGPADEARLPLTPAGEGHMRAVLPSTVELAEGRWDVYLGERPVEPGIRDLRALIDRVPDEEGRVNVHLPYPTADGRLAVRSWVRGPHAEAGGLTFGEGTCTVDGMLYGAELGPGAVAEARLGERVHQVPAEGGQGGFAFTLAYDPLAEPRPVDGQRLWELWLRPGPHAEPVRISRILDDVWDRKNVFVYPRHQGEGYTAAPCYTSDNDLCVRVTR